MQFPIPSLSKKIYRSYFFEFMAIDISKKSILSMDYERLIHHHFPLAVRGDIVTEVGNRILENNDFTNENTLFGTSCCPDEINVFANDFKSNWGNMFPLAGLAGLPFAGMTGFKAFISHRPDNGNLFILFASHIGIDENGNLGYVFRRGMTTKTPACGSAIAAYDALVDKQRGLKVDERLDKWDLQQTYIEMVVERSLKNIIRSPEPLLTLSNVLYDSIYRKIVKIIPQNFSGNIALLGGIQINTSLDYYDYFLTKEFKVINPGAGTELNLQNDLNDEISKL